MLASNNWEKLSLWMKELGLPLPLQERQFLASLDSFYTMFIAKNEVVNLTAIKDPEDFLWKHLADSFALSLCEPMGVLLDWGSGGGFPGIPLSLYRRSLGIDAPVCFLDSVGKKITAIKEFSDALDMPHAKMFYMRGEEFLKSKEAATVDTIVMRAVAPPERAVPWMNNGIPRWIYMLGPQQLDAWMKEERRLKNKGFIISKTHEYDLPAGRGSRVILEISAK